MSDYRNPDYDYRNPEDPFRRDAKFDPDVGAANVTWGWIAAAVFIVAILAVAFGMGHQPGGTHTASNDVTPPMINHTVPPATVPPPSMTPAPAVPPPLVGTAPNPPPAPAGSSQ
jgi:hypothetical protein